MDLENHRIKDYVGVIQGLYRFQSEVLNGNVWAALGYIPKVPNIQNAGFRV